MVYLFPPCCTSDSTNTIDELKTHLNGRKTHIRSLKPCKVVQEIYGWLLSHYAIRALMFQAASLKKQKAPFHDMEKELLC